MDIDLYSAQGSNSSQRVEWALNYKQLSYHRIEVSSDELSTTYLNINPLGYVPCLRINGHVYSESMAIIECLDECFPQNALLGSDIYQRAAIREICEYVNSSIHSPQNRTVLKHFQPNLSELNKREIRGGWIQACLLKLQVKLCLQSSFAIGQQFSLADIFVATIYKKGLQHGMSPISFYQEHLDWLRNDEVIALSEPD